LIDVPNDQLPKEASKIQVGDQFTSQSPDGHTQVFTVSKMNTASVTLDGNHPLAGQDLTFDVELIERREATDEEMSHGHVHGADGHGHDH
jgi:FKBP-type peptidyl-prolyl cis-trans isomerase SlyD